MLVLQAMHGLSLAQTEYLVADRLSWMRFCGLGPGDAVPDANTPWDFREALIAACALEALFTRLDAAITGGDHDVLVGPDSPWISRNRRLALDFERHFRIAAVFVRMAMICITLRRLLAKPSA